ncbi:MAG: peptidoglycan-binding protein [Clostridia bacterium]|nr:peptidoglycan-binding protein [Clostridia bacterium]
MKSLKAAFVALLLVVSLLLGGCYVEPNNIATGNQNGDSLNFPVYQPETPVPTAVPATPTDLPTDTPVQNNPAGINQGTDVGLPTSAVNNWLTTVAPMVTPDPSAKALVTPAPTSVPTATPVTSLKLGSQGQEVRNVQKKLKELGFYKGNIDGDFGEATEKAVKAFQKQYGLTVDGKVGSATMAKLASAKATVKPTASPTPKPTATPSYGANTYLRNGNSGKQVKQMQERLIALGYLLGKATSNFDNATEAGVLAFQRRHTSYADGVAGPETLKALYSSSASKASSASGIIGITLREGSSEKAAVRLLQQKLKSLGYYKGTVDGDFGSGTMEAVKAFQRGNNITADGVAGGGTLNKLFSSSAKSASAAAATATPRPATPRPTATPRVTPTPIPDNIYVLVTAAPNNQYATLRHGMYGTPVQQMQQALKNQGYFTGVVDGYFGDATEKAVEAFQRYNGLLIDGVAGPATLRTLLQGAYPFGS